MSAATHCLKLCSLFDRGTLIQPNIRMEFKAGTAVKIRNVVIRDLKNCGFFLNSFQSEGKTFARMFRAEGSFFYPQDDSRTYVQHFIPTYKTTLHHILEDNFLFINHANNNYLQKFSQNRKVFSITQPIFCLSKDYRKLKTEREYELQALSFKNKTECGYF